MRVAALALVLLVGAAVVLVFANTLNSWVLGGLLGGLAAILISIPISLALFTLLARRHDARTHSNEGPFAPAEEPEYVDEFYEDRLVYEAEGYVLDNEEDFPAAPRREPASGYLARGGYYEEEVEEEERFERQEPRNYPRQPRYPARALDPERGMITPQAPPPPAQQGSRRPRSTSSLSQHQSAALRKARQEAQQQEAENRTRPGSGSLSRRPPPGKPAQRSRTSRNLRPPSSSRTTGSQRPSSDQDTWETRQERVWRAHDEEDTVYDERFTTDQVRERHQPQHYPRRPSHPRYPRASRYTEPATGPFDDEEEDYEQDATASHRSRRASDRPGGSLHNPLVRRAPYLYEDDPLRDEFARQLGTDRPITRRSSRSEQYEDDEEY